MKIATYERPGVDRPALGVVLDAGDAGSFLVDLRHRSRQLDLAEAAYAFADMISFIGAGNLALETARGISAEAETLLADRGAEDPSLQDWIVPVSGARLRPPVPNPAKIVMVGSNYADHVSETISGGYHPAGRGLKPTYPNAFARYASTLAGHDEPVPFPDYGTQLDYEAEVAIVIGRRCKNVPTKRALDVVAGYTIMNDLSLRDVQFAERKTGTLLFGKNADKTAPCGPFLVTADELSDPHGLDIACRVNGETRQQDNTRNMLFSFEEIIAYCSRVELAPGDLLSTGTPAGVAIFRSDPEPYLLQVGDVVEAEVSSLGVLRNQIVRSSLD
jgi:acylpyruvate hydrolase